MVILILFFLLSAFSYFRVLIENRKLTISGPVGRILFEFQSVNLQIFSVLLTLWSPKSNHNSSRNRVHSLPQFCWIFPFSQRQQQQHKQQLQQTNKQQISPTSVVVNRIDCRIFGLIWNLDYWSGFLGLFGVVKISVYTVRFALLIWIVLSLI